jgi:hypothetical protein
MPWLTRVPELRIALVAGWLLVIARSLVFVLYDHAHFDSDQAIVGLMAKHLSEGRAFPLFFYGQSYMLAVEAWLAVPFFWIGGATVAMLHASIVATNLAVVTLLIAGFHRWGGLRPYLALVAALFIAFPPPNTSAMLVEAQGGNVEPFLWILLIWFVRQRPFWLGAILAVGFLNREFVLYVIPVLVAGQLWSRTFFERAALRDWLFAAIAFLAVWQSVRAFEPLSDAMGPGTRGAAVMATRGSQLENLSGRLQLNPEGMAGRLWTLVSREVSGLMGGHPLRDVVAPQGYSWLGLVLGVAMLTALVRVSQLSFDRRASLAPLGFGWFVFGVGVVAVVAYAATRPAEDTVRRYLLLSLMIPAGLTGLWLAMEPSRLIRRGVVALVVMWAAVSGIDNGRQFARFAFGQVPDPVGELANALEDRGITVAEAPYWRAYKITFLARERVKVASLDVVRITEYQRLAEAAGDSLVRISESGCAGGERVGDFYLCRR